MRVHRYQQRMMLNHKTKSPVIQNIRISLSRKRSVWPDLTFTPFVMETIGGWGGKGRRLLQKLIDLWAVERGATKKDASV